MMQRAVFIILFIASCTPWMNAPLALLGGLAISIFWGNPFLQLTKKYSKLLLQYSIIGLGFGLNAAVALQVSKDGFLLTLGTILLVFLLGFLFLKVFKIDRTTSVLISSGTAICGGSAIAAVSPVLNATSDRISIAIGTVFIMNAVALFIFPAIGTMLDLTQYQFGLWSAIAIHDTSSVIGAAEVYGTEALHVATTVKLSRALWIIPLTLVIALFVRKPSKISIPYFSVGFIVAALIATFIPEGKGVYQVIHKIARQLMVVSLFLIGASIHLQDLKVAGWKSIAYAGSIWVIISALSLLMIKLFYP